MKYLLLVLVFLTFVDATTRKPFQPDTLEQIRKNYIIPRVNELRRAYAKRFRTAAMYELEWNATLAEKPINFELNANWDAEGAWVEWRWCKMLGFEAALQNLSRKIPDINETELIAKIVEANNSEAIGLYELLTSSQKYIGCNLVNHTTVYICLLGPDGSVKSWNSSKGEPGSKCPDNYYNRDGLCSTVRPTIGTKVNKKSITPTTLTTPTTPTTPTTTKTTIGSTMRNSIAPITINQKRSTPLLPIQRSANSINGRSSQSGGISAEDDEQSGVPWLFYISLFVVLCIFFKCAVFNSV